METDRRGKKVDQARVIRDRIESGMGEGFDHAFGIRLKWVIPERETARLFIDLA